MQPRVEPLQKRREGWGDGHGVGSLRKLHQGAIEIEEKRRSIKKGERRGLIVHAPRWQAAPQISRASEC